MSKHGGGRRAREALLYLEAMINGPVLGIVGLGHNYTDDVGFGAVAIDKDIANEFGASEDGLEPLGTEKVTVGTASSVRQKCFLMDWESRTRCTRLHQV